MFMVRDGLMQMSTNAAQGQKPSMPVVVNDVW